MQLIPQKAYTQNTIHIPQPLSSEQRMQVIIKKGTEVIHEGILPLTHKLNKGRYKIQFRKQIMFHQEWYTYKVWSQELSVQNKQAKTTTHTASTFIIISIIFLFVFLFCISSFLIYHIRRRNRHDRHSAFPLVSLF